MACEPEFVARHVPECVVPEQAHPTSTHRVPTTVPEGLPPDTRRNELTAWCPPVAPCYPPARLTE